ADGLEKRKGGGGRLASDIISRHALAEAFRAILEHAADDDVVRTGAGVQGVADGPAKRDADLEGGDLDDAHGRPRSLPWFAVAEGHEGVAGHQARVALHPLVLVVHPAAVGP